MIDGGDGELNVSAFKYIDALRYLSKESLLILKTRLNQNIFMAWAVLSYSTH